MKKIWVAVYGIAIGACQTPQTTPESQQVAIEAAVNEEVRKVYEEFEATCERRVMELATLKADSAIAERMSAPLRGRDRVPFKPVRPEAPQADIPPFPLDSLK